jgi:hypothetical protein
MLHEVGEAPRVEAPRAPTRERGRTIAGAPA